MNLGFTYGVFGLLSAIFLFFTTLLVGSAPAG